MSPQFAIASEICPRILHMDMLFPQRPSDHDEQGTTISVDPIFDGLTIIFKCIHNRNVDIEINRIIMIVKRELCL